MKHTTFLIVSIVFGVVYTDMLSYFGFSFWLIFLLLPVYGYVQLYLSSRYNFRDSLALQPIPDKGYETRLRELDAHRKELENLGFIKFDEFYMQLSHDVVIYSYRHENFPIEACDYHFGQTHCTDLISKFENDRTLTTTNSHHAGKFPQPAEKLLQAYPRQNIYELLNWHLRAGKFLTDRGFQVKSFQPEFYRNSFLADFMKSKKLFTGLLSPLKSFYWVTMNKNNPHLKGIEEQFLARTLELPAG